MTSRKWIRESLDHGLSLHRMVLLSLFLHAVVLSIIFFSHSLPTPKWTFGPVYSVQLVSFPNNFMNRQGQSASSGEFSDRRTADRNIILKKQADTISSMPLKRAETQKQDFTGVEKAIDNIRQRVTSTAQPQTGESAVGTKMNSYYAAIWARIKNRWVLPQSILPRENIEAVVHAKILRNGAVTDLSFEKRSGNRYFDESAMKAVRKASPFPPLPEWAQGGSIEIGIRFHSSDLR